MLSAKRLRLDPDRDGIVPRRVHFNDNPVSESVEIPRTPKQQFTRKRLQLASFADPEDKETEEMEGVTSLVMYPDLVDNKVTIFWTFDFLLAPYLTHVAFRITSPVFSTSSLQASGTRI